MTDGEQIENALNRIDRKGLYVFTCSQGGAGWAVKLRNKSERPFIHNRVRTVYVRSGAGKTLGLALLDAVTEPFDDILG